MTVDPVLRDRRWWSDETEQHAVALVAALRHIPEQHQFDAWALATKLILETSSMTNGAVRVFGKFPDSLGDRSGDPA